MQIGIDVPEATIITEPLVLYGLLLMCLTSLS